MIVRSSNLRPMCFIFCTRPLQNHPRKNIPTGSGRPGQQSYGETPHARASRNCAAITPCAMRASIRSSKALPSGCDMRSTRLACCDRTSRPPKWLAPQSSPCYSTATALLLHVPCETLALVPCLLWRSSQTENIGTTPSDHMSTTCQLAEILRTWTQNYSGLRCTISSPFASPKKLRASRMPC